MQRRRALSIAAACAVLALVPACSDDSGGDDAATTTATAEQTTTSGPTGEGSTTTGVGGGGAATASELCESAEVVTPSPTVQSTDLVEISGVASSRANADILWTHNDSGGEPEALAITTDGGGGRRYRFGGVEPRDWEDMALGPGPDDEVDDLYMGDIGDNFSQRENVVIYQAPEPEVDLSEMEPVVLDEHDSITLTYADGARDAETLLSDPVTGDLFIVSKEWSGAPTGVYRIPADAEWGSSVTMERVAETPLPAGELATGGDISADGSVIAVRTYDSVLLWERRPDQTVDEAMAGQPCQAPVVDEAQGESVAFSPDGRGYVTISEGGNPPIHWFQLPD